MSPHGLERRAKINNRDNLSADQYAEWPDYYDDPVGHCVAALKQGNDSERFNAADILRGLAFDAEPALPVLVKTMLNDKNDQVRSQCTFALIDIGYALKEKANLAVLPLMYALANDENAEVRSLATDALAAIGLTAHEVVLSLKRALQDEHKWVRESAQEALGKLGE